MWTRARLGWAAMAPQQRRWTIAAAACLSYCCGGLLWYGLRTDWRTLYAGLDPDDARQVGLTLTQAQIPYDVADNGTTLRVPAAQLDKARLATAAKGVKSGRMGFELFDKPNWVGSEFDEQVNYQRALEGELEHTVGSLTDVESARVHLVLAHDSLFRDQDRPAKASVVLKLRRGALADGEADAIRNLVASAVDGLAADHVVLVDASGHLPLGPKTPEALQLGAEQALEEKLISTLEPVTGVGNVRASVTLDYDPRCARRDKGKLRSHPVRDAFDGAHRANQRRAADCSWSSGNRVECTQHPGASGVSEADYAASDPRRPNREPMVFRKRFATSLRTPGRCIGSRRRLWSTTASFRPRSKTTAAKWQPRSADELRNLTALAQAAVGFDASRGDVVTVQDLSFEENRAQPCRLPRRRRCCQSWRVRRCL